MKSIILAGLLGLISVTSAAYAETGTWHRFKEYDIGSPRPAGQPSPLSCCR